MRHYRTFTAGDKCDWCDRKMTFAYLFAGVGLCEECAFTPRGEQVDAQNGLLALEYYAANPPKPEAVL